MLKCSPFAFLPAEKGKVYSQSITLSINKDEKTTGRKETDVISVCHNIYFWGSSKHALHLNLKEELAEATFQCIFCNTKIAQIRLEEAAVQGLRTVGESGWERQNCNRQKHLLRLWRPFNSKSVFFCFYSKMTQCIHTEQGKWSKLYFVLWFTEDDKRVDWAPPFTADPLPFP